MAKIPVTTVWVNRAEGPTKEVGERTVTSLEAADAILRRWARTAPEEGHGYDKTDFVITWADGEEYRGRFDLQHEHATAKSLLGPHVTNWLTFHAGLHYPEHLTREDYDRYLKQVGFEEGSEKRQEALNLLQNYEI